MARVSLRIYNREIENLIDQGQTDEAIAHCKHILKTFPKHIETYRLLGKAFLESERYTDAAEIFQRVLLAVPDDFVSHVGMSIIRDNEGKLDEAIWHMERAFERQPSNAAVQAELQRLYGCRDGVEPPKIRMTRGALAHMYVQGELYPQAIAEIRSLLAEDPSRVDMQVLLALAYFRNGQKVEATELTSSLLKRYAYCLDANRILVEVLSGTELAENTQVYRHRVNELDPYAAFVTASVFQSDSVPDAAVNLERLDYRPRQAVDTSTVWPASLQSPVDEHREQKIPDWLQSAEPPEKAPTSDDSIPDFMRAAGWNLATGAAAESEAAFDQLQEETIAEEALPAEDIPDWLKAMAPIEETSAPTAAVEAAEAESPFTAEELPDWLQSLKPTDSPSGELLTEETTMTQGQGDLPDWLTGQGQEEAPAPSPLTQPGQSPASIGDLGTSKEEQEASFAWLENLAARQGARPDELLTPPDERLESAPQWVQQAAEVASAPAVAPSESPAEEEDWIKELALQEEIDLPTAQPEIADASIDTTSAWLRMLDEQEQAPVKAEAPAEDEDIPDWLKTIKEEAAVESQAVEPRIDRATEPEALPDWLQAIEQPSAPPPEASPAEELPEWLRADLEAETKQKPTSPAEWQPAEPTAPAYSEPATQPIPEIQQAIPAAPPAPKPVPQPVPEPVAELMAERHRGRTDALSPDPTLRAAQAAMKVGDIQTALQEYGKIIKKARLLEEVIFDLREALYLYPLDVLIWQALGDAYMRANRLQDALDAYTKAEELLR
ncbi:MAG: tetratricopeptide repeat protein [Candidatus Villigracilaceae bacterium]